MILDSDLLDRKRYKYSDLGYYLLQRFIENEYDQNLNFLIDEHFYEKIGMENMGYLPRENIEKSRMVPTEYDYLFRGQLIHGYVHDQGAAMLGGVGGHAGVFGNANDLCKIMQMYLNQGEYGEERYLSSEVVKEFTSYQFRKDNNRRGAGFDKPALEKGGSACESASELSFGHSGFTGTLVWADPKSEIIYIFLSNRIHPDADNRKLITMNIRTDIMQVIYDYLDEK